MEAAALLSFATAGGRKVMCFSHVTNEMATNTEDFDKGGQSGHETALRLCEVALESLLTMDAVG
jgi:hypothetical protein